MFFGLRKIFKDECRLFRIIWQMLIWVLLNKSKWEGPYYLDGMPNDMKVQFFIPEQIQCIYCFCPTRWRTCSLCESLQHYIDPYTCTKCVLYYKPIYFWLTNLLCHNYFYLMRKERGCLKMQISYRWYLFNIHLILYVIIHMINIKQINVTRIF